MVFNTDSQRKGGRLRRELALAATKSRSRESKSNRGVVNLLIVAGKGLPALPTPQRNAGRGRSPFRPAIKDCRRLAAHHSHRAYLVICGKKLAKQRRMKGEEREGRASVERSETGGRGAADAPRSPRQGGLARLPPAVPHVVRHKQDGAKPLRKNLCELCVKNPPCQSVTIRVNPWLKTPAPKGLSQTSLRLCVRNTRLAITSRRYAL